MPEKIIVSFLIFLILVAGFAIPLRTHAILGIADVVIDPAHIAANVTGWIQEWGRWILDKALEFVLAQLKDRLLDNLVNQTVQWIQGNGDPRFITDPEQFFGDAASAAVGDTLQEVGLSEMCTGLKPRLTIQLQQPTFRNTTNCTLDDVVDNIESFKGDFRNGGWLAFNESLQPQNNYLGARALAHQELLNKEDEKEQEAQTQAISGQGFKGQERCLEWQEIVDPAASDLPSAGEIRTGQDFYLESPDGVPYRGNEYPQGSGWRCTKEQTITPGDTIAGSVDKAVGKDIDRLVNATSLETYISAVVDAMVNRLAQEAASGLLGMFNPSEGSAPMGQGEGCSDLEGEAQSACEEYQDQQDEAENEAESGTGDLEEQRDEAEDEANEINDREDCYDLPGFVQDECLEMFDNATSTESNGGSSTSNGGGGSSSDGNGNNDPIADAGTGHALRSGFDHSHFGASASDSDGDLARYSWSLTNCPGTCPTLSGSSGNLVGSSMDVPEPTYRPQAPGNYTLQLTVFDSNDNSDTDSVVETLTAE